MVNNTAASEPISLLRRIPQLDGLRGVAIAMVLAYHYVRYGIEAGAPRFVNILIPLTSFGWSGVDLFFVLSGFLIGGILLDARGSSNYFRVFYRRRLCRIFPAYFAFLAIVTLAARCFSSSPFHVAFLPGIPWPASVTFSQNLWMAARNTLGPYTTSQIWSLAVEEQFYLIIPALIWFARPRLLMQIVMVGIAISPLVRFMIFIFRPDLTTAIYVLLPCRMDSLLVGVAIAHFVRQAGALEFARARIGQLWTAIEVLTAVATFILIRAAKLIPVTAYDPLTMIVGHDILALLFGCVLIASLVDPKLAGMLQKKWLIDLGTIAYCTYLIHPLVFELTYAALRNITGSGISMAVVALFLTVVIAKASWQWLEKPFLATGHRVSYEKSLHLGKLN